MNRILPRIIFLLGLFAGMLAPLVAAAHTPLTGSVPREGAVLAPNQAPRRLELRFGHPLRLTSVSLQRNGGKKVALKPARRAGTVHAVRLPALSPGDYLAEWRGMASDGHVMSGAVRFRVAAR